MTDRQDLDHFHRLATMQVSTSNDKLNKLIEAQQNDPENPMALVRLALGHAQQAAVLTASAPLLNSVDSSFKDARLELGSALGCFERVYVTRVLSSPSENLAQMEGLSDYPELTRYRDLRILGLLLDLLWEAHPSRDPRWLVGMHGLFDRHAVLLRNSAVLMGMRELLQQNNKLARARTAYASLAFRALRDRAEAGRARFESMRNPADMEVAIRFCASIIPLLTLLGKDKEAQEFKKKREVWERRLHEETEGN